MFAFYYGPSEYVYSGGFFVLGMDRMVAQDLTGEGGGFHLLVVDDDRRIRTLLSEFLRGEGFVVTTAGDGEGALGLMRSFVFDLLIVDVMMPGLSGIELVSQIRQDHPSQLMVILSALGGTAHRVEGLLAGCDDYIPKPFDPQELSLRLRALLRRREVGGGRYEEVGFGEFRFHLSRGELRKGGECVPLSLRQRECLRILARRPNETVLRSELSVNDGAEAIRGVDVQITRLRRSIEADPSKPVFLETVRGEGYRLNAFFVATGGETMLGS